MDYTDIYLRQRRDENSVPHASSGPVGMETAAEQRVERVLKGAFSVQQLVDRIEGLSTRVDAFDEKMLNLTKLVKLAQGLQEDKEGELRRQQHELRSRLKRQEQLTTRLQEELAALREQVPSAIRDKVIEAQRENMNEVIKACKERKEELHQLRGDVENAVGALRKDAEQNAITVQREIATSASSQTETQNRLREQLSLLEQNVRALEAGRVTTETTRLVPLETAMLRVTETLDSLQPKVGAASAAVEALGEQRRRDHAAIADEMGSTREWAARNLQRVRQHVEGLSSEVAQLQREQADLAGRLRRVSCQADVEYKKLRILLQQKAREADALGGLVGKELGKVEDMTERHQGLRTEAGALKSMAF
ncbi:hypothetical protein TRSC58_01857 [Trypanosoma rangeli SC58]|uniref:Uncharacterized protein n=1 Tax=Trypanosoma rangeli SC58 TaxID=429131 RepID=A0A061J8F5_TRYRA|nr:hypothetical protein TRSC58_01857 [Trypanosoma rangeli SC58]